MENPSIVGIALWWQTIALPAVVFEQCIRCPPLLEVERWIGDDIVLAIDEIKFSETKEYVQKVLKAKNIYKNSYKEE